MADKNDDGYIQASDSDPGGSPGYTEILQENHYYAFGLNMEGPWHAPTAPEDKVNRYQYNGKELNDDIGLGWSDYGARWYDAAVGRFTGVDPLAADYAAWSPYNYTFDNPIRFVDPDGRSADDIIDVDKKTGSISVTKAPGNDIVRLVNNGKVEDSYGYGDNGSFSSDFKITEGKFNGKDGIALSTTDNVEKAQAFFEFAAQSNVEFGKLDVKKGDKVFSIVTTTHEPDKISSLPVMVNKFSKKGFTGLKQTHSHPDGQSVPSGYFGNVPGNSNSLTPVPSNHRDYKKGDAQAAREANGFRGFEKMKFEVYNPIGCTITTYDGVNRAKIQKL